MAGYYFWADTDNDWECGAGNNWRDAADGGGNPIVGQPGAGDDITIEQDCVTDADHSATVFQTGNIEAGATLTVANGGDIRFDTSGAQIDGTLLIQTGGSVRYTEVDVTQGVASEIAMDGGDLHLITTGAVERAINFRNITATANGGTIHLTCNTARKSILDAEANGASIVGDSGAYLDIVCDGGAAAGAIYSSFRTDVLLQYLDIQDAAGVYLEASNSPRVIDCLVRGVNTTPGYGVSVTERSAYLRNVAIDKTAKGVNVDSAIAFLVDCALGETIANTQDIYTVYAARVLAFNTKMSSATEVTMVNSQIGTRVLSTAHDQHAEKFKLWWDRGHEIESEFTIVQGSSRQSIKVVTAASCAATEQDRLDWPLAVWPATHGDTLDVSVYVYGTQGDKIQVHVDPNSHYGTTQTTECTIAQTNTWEQVVVAQYTVNTIADEKMGIPIIIWCEEPSNTYYIDTLAVTQA